MAPLREQRVEVIRAARRELAMPKRLRATVLAFLTASLLTVATTLVTLASDGQVPFPR